MNIVKNMSDVVKGALLMISGLALLLNTLGILTDFLWYALIIISIYLIIVGFIKLKGVEAVKCLISRKNKDVIIKQEVNTKE